MKIILTGSAGFIGKNTLEALRAEGYRDILLVDKDNCVEFLEKAETDSLPPAEAIIHLGASTDTTEKDRDFLIRNNALYSKTLFDYCARNGTRFIYASSAATYGDGRKGFRDTERNLKPLNFYAESKYLFDELVLDSEEKPSQRVGLKFFNVYGPGEKHKGRMASMVYQGFVQIRESGKLRLFRSTRSDSPDGSERRDFIYVGDAARVILYFLRHPELSGIYNVGTGKARTFLEMALYLFAALGRTPDIQWVDMPGEIKRHYQYFTQADLTSLKNAGFPCDFVPLEEGVKKCVLAYEKGQ